MEPVVHIWGLEGDRPRFSLEHTGSVECLAFAATGKFLAAGAAEQRVSVWAYPSRKLVGEFTQPGNPPAVTALAWSADASQLLAGRANHTVQLWDLKARKPRLNLVVLAPVQSVSWAAGGKAIASCTIDRCVRFWGSTNGQIQMTVVAQTDQLSCIAPEGYYSTPNETELVCVVLTAKGMDCVCAARVRGEVRLEEQPGQGEDDGELIQAPAERVRLVNASFSRGSENRAGAAPFAEARRPHAVR